MERESGGIAVIYWYHRQFIETARHRYLTESKSKLIHQNIAYYFLEKWAYGMYTCELYLIYIYIYIYIYAFWQKSNCNVFSLKTYERYWKNMLRSLNDCACMTNLALTWVVSTFVIHWFEFVLYLSVWQTVVSFFLIWMEEYVYNLKQRRYLIYAYNYIHIYKHTNQFIHSCAGLNPSSPLLLISRQSCL